MGKKEKPKNLWALAVEQTDEFIDKELKKFKKDLNRLYREDLKADLGLSKKEVRRYIDDLAAPYLEKISKPYLKKRHKKQKGGG